MKRIALCAALTAAFPACAVTLSNDGLGQALIYPYYTAQSSRGDPYNTYISVVNHTVDAKALRLRFREGRLGKPVLDMNLYLSPNDVWTGAVIPFSIGTRLISTDVSCTEPRFAVTVAPGEAPFIDFRNDVFSGGNDDGAGTGLDRTREGFVEIIEMATLTGASAVAVTHNAAGVPRDCAAILSTDPLTAAPTGGLSGTLTLINVANGTDFNVNATALGQLAQRPFFRRASDPYPDFNAAEIDAVSLVSSGGSTYRSIWPRPVDAVSAVLMRTAALGEYALDVPNAALTDFVLTLPTRHFYLTPTTAAAPFTAPGRWVPGCPTATEPLSITFYNRDSQSASASADSPPFGNGVKGICASAAVSSVRNTALPQMNGLPTTPTAVFGSETMGLNGSGSGRINVVPNSRFQSGWITIVPLAFPEAPPLMSAASSMRLDHVSAQSVTGAHAFKGLPMLGFSARIFRNGTLRCDAGTCQGNYGGAFPFKYRRTISPAP